MIITILTFIFVFGLIVFIHELGHFLVAKRAGVGVEEFAFGFPPRLFAKKIGQTEYAINLIPLGGYVRLLGEDGASSDPRAFGQASVGARALIISAGVVFNLLLTWVLLTIILIVPTRFKAADAVFVSAVLPHSAAESAGVKSGDLLLSIDGAAIHNPTELRQVTGEKAGNQASLELRRNGVTEKKSVIFGSGDAPLGVMVTSLSLGDQSNPPVWKAPFVALQGIGRVAQANFSFLWSLVLVLVGKAHVSGDQVSGPVGIYGILAQFTALGWPYVLFGAAQLSLAIALFNILPIPALDGGRLLFIVLEKVFRKRVLSQSIEATIHFVGFALLIGLFVLVTWHDIAKLIH